MSYPVHIYAIKSEAIIDYFDRQIVMIYGMYGHLNRVSAGVPADVVERFLDDPVKLYPFDMCELQPVFELRLAIELVGELFFGGKVRDRIGERPFERRQKSDILQRSEERRVGKESRSKE